MTTQYSFSLYSKAVLRGMSSSSPRRVSLVLEMLSCLTWARKYSVLCLASTSILTRPVTQWLWSVSHETIQQQRWTICHDKFLWDRELPIGNLEHWAKHKFLWDYFPILTKETDYYSEESSQDFQLCPPITTHLWRGLSWGLGEARDHSGEVSSAWVDEDQSPTLLHSYQPRLELKMFEPALLPQTL